MFPGVESKFVAPNRSLKSRNPCYPAPTFSSFPRVGVWIYLQIDSFATVFVHTSGSETVAWWYQECDASQIPDLFWYDSTEHPSLWYSQGWKGRNETSVALSQPKYGIL